ncbi:MAG: extracellular solute-binding protein [Chloroflexi bacterium]|nr:extracellular solute-binding protein [Chloroflexota bacterium]
MSCHDLSVKNRHSRCTWLLLLLLILSCVSGCAEAPPPAEPVTITFAYDGPAEYYERLIQEFNETYPYITIEMSSSDDDADVFVITPFDLSDLLEENGILSLDPFIEQDESFDVSDFYAGTVELCSREGKVWAVPTEVLVRVIYYNKDLFDAYGVSYPESGWTWDDLLTRALALRDSQANVFGYAETDRVLDSLAFIYQHGGRILDDVQNPTRTTLDDPLTIEALEWYATLMYEHDAALKDDQRYDVGGTLESGVYLGQIGMWTGWFAERGGIDGGGSNWPAEWKMRWGMVPLPRDAQSAIPAVVFGYAISAQAMSPDACWKWITFLSKQVQTPYNMTPARRSLVESADYEQFVGGDVAAVARQSMEDTMLLSPALVEFMPFDAYFRAIDDIVNGRATPQEAMTRAQQEVEQ